MCKCRPGVKTPFCGKRGCEWPEQKVDTFRKEYKPLSDGQKNLMEMVKNTAEDLEALFCKSGTPDNSREMEEAIKYLETATMWAVKGITK